MSKSVGFFNTLGKATQSQNWNILSGKVWATQVMYDFQGRLAFESLSAPHGNSFGYNPKPMNAISKYLIISNKELTR